MASCGMRNSPRRSVPPASAVFIRWAASQTVSPSGTAPVSLPRIARCSECESPDTGDDGGPPVRWSGVSVPLRLRARFGADVPTPPAEPVTVTVARVVRPDQRAAFERWAEDVLQVAAGFPGNLGASLLHPGPDSSEYHLVYRFVDDASWPPGSGRRSGGRRSPTSSRWWTTSATTGWPASRASSRARRPPARAGG